MLSRIVLKKQEPIPTEKSQNSQRGNCWGAGTMRLQAEWILEPWQLLSLGSFFYPRTHANEGHWVLGNCEILNIPLSPLILTSVVG